MLSIAFLLFIVIAIITWPMIEEVRLATILVSSGSLFLVGLIINMVLSSSGYCGTMLFRTLTIYLPGWTLALALLRLILASTDYNTSARNSSGADNVTGRLALCAVYVCIIGFATLIAVANDPMVESRAFEYNGNHYVGTPAGLSTSPVIYEDMGPIICRKLDLPYDSSLYHELADAYWKAR